jgi:medium-chain acyl-[acyl-carrier-protein] hydrolase
MATSKEPHSWVVFPKPNPQARFRLFCFPYAGGGATIYRAWPDDLPSHIEICAIQPPGRENRFLEPRFTHLPALVRALDTAIDPYLQAMPFAFFGHSLGALMGFELIRALQKRQGPLPLHLFVAAHRAPQFLERHIRLYDLPDEVFLKELRRLDGTPQEVTENTDLMEVMMPLLRADFELAESYTYQESDPLLCPITAIGGVSDRDVNEKELDGWRQQTTGDFHLHMLVGDHFFLAKNRTALLQIITDQISVYSR